MNVERAYHMFTAIRLHFTTKYDYFKYNGKIPDRCCDLKMPGLVQRDLATYVPHSNLKWHYVANFAYSPSVRWYGDLDSKYYNQLTQYFSNPAYKFEEDVKKIDVWKNIALTTPSPVLVQQVLTGEVAIETACLIHWVFTRQTDLIGTWKSAYSIDPFLQGLFRRMEKYLPFILLNISEPVAQEMVKSLQRNAEQFSNKI